MRVLIVENDEAICLASKRVLAHVGHEVRSVSRMSECAKNIADFKPDFVILDLGLPDTQGTETLEAMQGLVGYDIPIIAFSAETVWEEECFRLGIADYMLKGQFTPVDLPEAINRACACFKLSTAIRNDQKALSGEHSWPGHKKTNPDEVADRLVSMASEIRLLAAGG